MASGLIHVGIPAVTSVVGDMIGGSVGGVSGAVLGNMAGHAIGDKTGYGLTSPDKIHTPYITVIGGIPIPFHKSVRTTKDRRVLHGSSFLSI